MNSINYFSIREEYSSDEDEFYDTGKRKRTREEGINEITEELSKVKIKKFKMEDYSYNEPTYNRITKLVSVKIQKLLSNFPYTFLNDCIMSGNFQEYSMNVEWNVIIKIISITVEGIRKSYQIENINTNTIVIPYGSVVRTVNCPLMSRQFMNKKIRILVYEAIIKIDKNFLRNDEKFKKMTDKIVLKEYKPIVSWIPDLSQLSLK